MTEHSADAARVRLEVLLEVHDHLPLGMCAALLCAEEHSGVDPEVVDAELDALARRLVLRDDMPDHECVARANWLLFRDLGFTGDLETYDHPDNSLLDRVLARKKGLPILLSLIYIEVCRRAGFAVDGVAFPGHFLVTPRGAEPRYFIDPFNQGRVLTPSVLRQRLEKMQDRSISDDEFRACTRRVGPRYLLVRLNNNLKGSYLRRGNLAGAARAAERMLLLAPSLVEERRDYGMMLAELGKRERAIEQLERYLVEADGSAETGPVVERLAVLRRTRDDS